MLGLFFLGFYEAQHNFLTYFKLCLSIKTQHKLHFGVAMLLMHLGNSMFCCDYTNKCQ